MIAAAGLRGAGYFLLGWVVAGLLLMAWQLSASGSDTVYVATFGDAATALWQLITEATLRSDVLPSMWRLLSGYVAGSLIGIVVGIALGYLRSLEPWVRPVLEFLRAVPVPTILPVAVLLLGTGYTMQVTIIAFGSCWPVLLNALDGARGVDPLLIDTARVNRMGTVATLRRVVFPATLPQIFAGLRTALGIALIMMVVSEMIAASSGLGYFILQAQRTFSVPEVYGGVLLIGVVGWGFTILLSLLESRVLSWHHEQKGGWRG